MRHIITPVGCGVEHITNIYIYIHSLGILAIAFDLAQPPWHIHTYTHISFPLCLCDNDYGSGHWPLIHSSTIGWQCRMSSFILTSSFNVLSERTQQYSHIWCAHPKWQHTVCCCRRTLPMYLEEVTTSTNWLDLTRSWASSGFSYFVSYVITWSWD